MKMEDINNPLLDNLFAEARTEAPQHSFRATKKSLLSGLAIGGAGLLTAKLITSSILKSKFFIMSISAVTVLSTAVVVYTTAVKPNESISLDKTNPKTEFVATNTTMGSVLPENLFVEAPKITESFLTEVEPDDTTVVIEADSSQKVAEIIEEVMQTINLEKIEREIEHAMLSIDTEKLENAIEEMVASIDGEALENAVDDLIESIQSIEISHENVDMAIARLAQDSARLEQVKAQLDQLKSIHIDIDDISDIEDIDEIGHTGETYSYSYTSKSSVTEVGGGSSKKMTDDLTKRVFTINNQTTEADLKDFNEVATKAGIDMSYNCKIKSNKIKQLNMRLKIDNGNGKNYSNDFHIHDIKKGDGFSFNVVWYEDEDGKAVRFNDKQSICRQRSRTNCN